MVKVLKKSELAKALDLGNASITMAVKNKVLLIDEHGNIDIDKPTNNLWIEKQKAKGKEFDLNRIYTKREIHPKTQAEQALDKQQQKGKQIETYDNSPLLELELKQKKATLKRTEKAIELDEIKIQKQMGLLIPFDESEFLLIYIVEKIRSQANQEIESMANIYKDRFGISQDEYIELKKDLNGSVNNIIIQAVSELNAGLSGIQDKYSEARGRGERK